MELFNKLYLIQEISLGRKQSKYMGFPQRIINRKWCAATWIYNNQQNDINNRQKEAATYIYLEQLRISQISFAEHVKQPASVLKSKF